MDALPFNDKATILVVDDTPDNLALMSALLKKTYKGESCQPRRQGTPDRDIGDAS
jgi:response regulator RpfG family c-di-GMP phosphodiesterase